MSNRLDMSARAVEARLVECAHRSAVEEVERIDMSPRAVERRLLECAELSALCAELATSRAADRSSGR